MRNILFLGAIATLTACGLSEDSFEDESLAETCRILVLCEAYDDAATCESELSEMSSDVECTGYDGGAAKACIDALKEVTECPTDGSFPSECDTDTIYESCGDDSGM